MADMTFAQALTEARQIIVQQSNRIKTDLEKIKALQQSQGEQAATIADRDRQIKSCTSDISERDTQISELTEKLKLATTSREQADAIIDRQGQRLTQMQTTVADLERKTAEQAEHLSKLTTELDGLRQQMPTREDEEALAALSTLLSNKKVPMPASGRPLTPTLRITPEHHAEAA